MSSLGKIFITVPQVISHAYNYKHSSGLVYSRTVSQFHAMLMKCPFECGFLFSIQTGLVWFACFAGTHVEIVQINFGFP